MLDHSEDEALSAGGAIHKGEISARHGVKGIDADSEAVHVERGCEFSAATGGHYHVLHALLPGLFGLLRKPRRREAESLQRYHRTTFFCVTRISQ